MSAVVSVIMPVYNAEKYLRAAVESVLNQSYGDLELIIVDDGATDSSPAICDEFARRDARVRVLHRNNAGPASARNAALDVACGKYLMFCDSDDEYYPDFCRTMIERIEGAPVDMVSCRCTYHREEELSDDYLVERLGVNNAYFELGRPGMVAAGTEKRFFGVNVLLWCKIFKREIVVNFGIRFPDGHENDDDAFCYQYAMVSGDALLIPDRQYRYCLRSGSITDSYVQRCPRNRRDRLDIADFLMVFARRHGLDEKFAGFFVRLWCDSYNMVKPFFSDEELPELRREVIAKASPCFSAYCRLVECEEEIFRIARKGTFADLLMAGWHRLRALVVRNPEKRRRALVRCARSLVLWKNK